jgi:putative ABC transport system permease protein
MSLLQDVRYAIRMLARTPGFTAVAILTLALGIGANAAIFSLVYATLLKPLPFHDPSRLVVAWDTYLPQYPKLGVSPAELELWQQQTDLFQSSAWFRSISHDLSMVAAGSEAVEVHPALVSTGFFSLLGVNTQVGRTFSSDEPPTSAILSDTLWRTKFAADPAVVGKAIRLADQSFTVIGVMPAGFGLPSYADMWLPPGPLLADELTNPVRHAAAFLGRLRPGVTTRQAAARLEGLAKRLAAEHPKTSTGWGMQVYNLQDDLTARIRPALLVLLGAVALVLLIACANVANLLLARATSRTKEMAVRSALGAGRWRIARQLLTESAVLSLTGGALGLIGARAGLAAFSPIPAVVDGNVLLFLLAISIATGMAFGLAPVLQVLRADSNTAMKDGSVARGSSGVRSALVVAELALALVLVTSAGILAKGFLRLIHVDPGFRPQGVLTARLTFPPSRKPDDLFRRIQDRVMQMPGVDSFASTTALPLTTGHGNQSRFNIPGNPLIRPDALPSAEVRYVSPEYFKTMGITLRSGRFFTEKDQDAVIINETMARRFWPGRDPVGMKYVTGPWGPNPTWSTVAGVVSDVKQAGLDADATFDEYFPALFPQYVVVHMPGNAEAAAPAFRRILQSVDPDVPVSDVQSMDQVVEESAASRRWTAALLGTFAALALVLALVGIYGVMSWTVAQRTREIGIRVALGASSRQVLGSVVGYGMKLCAAGLLIGVAGAFAAKRLLAGLVYGVSTADPWIYAGVAFLMLVVALAACYLPARRASRVDPLAALRCE